MVKIFIKHILPAVRYLPVLYPNLGVLMNEKKLFADRGNRAMRFPVVEIVKDLREADFILLPHEYFEVVDRYPEYLNEHLTLSAESGKKLLIFDLSDYSEKDIAVSDAWIFRIADYASRKRDNVIVMPTFIEDLGATGVPTPRVKKERPVVGFCGWAGFRNSREYLKFIIKNILADLRRFTAPDSHLAAHKQGIYFRRWALQVLRGAATRGLFLTNFITRRSYSSHINTVEKSPVELRNEYIRNIIDSDLALSVRGDANASCRFFEILSLGRVPLFVDTDCVLPLAEEIDYKKFVVFTDYRDIDRLGDAIHEFWERTSSEEFMAMQKMAREHFDKYLSVDSFLAHVLPKLIGR
jgi:hypothetical protein